MLKQSLCSHLCYVFFPKSFILSAMGIFGYLISWYLFFGYSWHANMSIYFKEMCLHLAYAWQTCILTIGCWNILLCYAQPLILHHWPKSATERHKITREGAEDLGRARKDRRGKGTEQSLSNTQVQNHLNFKAVLVRHTRSMKNYHTNYHI